MPERVGVIGAGYVGLTSAACLAHLGHDVTCVDIDEGKVDALASGRVAIGEPGLQRLLREGLAAGTLRFDTALAALSGSEVVLLCLPTPEGTGGTADLGILRGVLGALTGVLRRDGVLVVKSTVPVGTNERIAGILGRQDVAAVSNPEFLREGHAVHDFLHPDRIVVGARDRAAAEVTCLLYQSLDAPVVCTDPASAELAKYASNAFLAMKLSYVNSLAELCERFGADIAEVTRTMGLDARIGPEFLAPGPGWGGSCLPKDTSALLRSAGAAGVDFPLLRAAVESNAHQQDEVVRKVRLGVTGSPEGSLRGVRIGLLGLAFKAGTGDLRHSPAVAVAERLAAAGAVLTGYDPAVPAPGGPVDPVHVVDDPYLVAKDAEALVLLTDWPQFRELDWGQVAELAERTIVIDTRNALDPAVLAEHGFARAGIGTADRVSHGKEDAVEC